MKRTTPLLFIGLAALLCVGLVRSVYAGPGSTTATKIGYVDLEKALNDVEDGKKAKEKLKSAFEEKQKALDTKVSDFKSKKEEYDKRAPLLKPEAKDKEEKEL